MKEKTRGKKPKCYEAYRPGVCLGTMTRKGTPGCRCIKCRWFEDNAKKSKKGGGVNGEG